VGGMRERKIRMSVLGGRGLVGASFLEGVDGEKRCLGGREGMDGEVVLSKRTEVLAFPLVVLVPG